MQIITAQDERLLSWAEQRLSIRIQASQSRWIAGVEGSSIVFVVVYSHFSARDCVMTIATDGKKTWATKRSLRAIFAVPFVQWRLRRVTFLVRADNSSSIRMCKKAGAHIEGVMRKAFPGDVNGILFGLLSEECRYLKKEMR